LEKRFFVRVVGSIAGILGLVFAFNYVVDPFNLNGRFDLGLPKTTTSQVIDWRLYKSIEFARHPEPTIVLGDSRCVAWNVEWFAEEGEPHVYNFSFGGGSLQEAIDAFWFADSRVPLERVYLCIPFSLYSAESVASLMQQARELADDPVRYYLSPLVTKASYENLYAKRTGEKLRPGNPTTDRAAFWEFQLEKTAPKQFAGWAPPDDLWPELERVAQHCRERGIDLRIVIPPTHVKLQARVADFGHAREFAAYRCELARLAPVLDFDWPNELTRDDAAFVDPYHMEPEAARRIVRGVVAGSSPDARLYPWDPAGGSCLTEPPGR